MARVLLQNVTKIFDGPALIFRPIGADGRPADPKNKCGVIAVSDFSLDVADGEFMVIVGPSGCGKTTTLRMIAGLEKPTSGNIYIGETLANDIPPKDRDIAMVFQNYALYPHMTVYQNMEFALKMRKVPKPQIRQRVGEAASLLGIDHLLNRKPRALSGGQRQRVALGRAIVRNPRAFLFDEPLSNLDAQLRASTRVELKALHNKLRATSIYVTHDQAEAMTLGDRICLMRNGVVQQVGAPMEVYDKPVNRFVAGFIGTPPMNFFSGRVEFTNDTACFKFASNTIKLPLRLKAVLADYRDREMILGIRPEHLSLHPLQDQTDNTVTARVNAVEHLGTRTDLYLTSNSGADLVASIGTDLRPKLGEAIKICIDLQKIHVFDSGKTGKNVTED